MANISKIITDLDNLSVSNSYTCAPEQCLSYIKEQNKTITALHLNIRSINKNFSNLKVFLTRLNFDCDIIVLSECWLSKVATIPVLEGYTSYCTGNTINQNDGITIYIKNNIKCSVLEPHFVDANCLVCKLETDAVFIAIYRPPSFRNIDNFITSLNNVLNKSTSYTII